MIGAEPLGIRELEMEVVLSRVSETRKESRQASKRFFPVWTLP